jgi:hypothetical protein
MARSTNRSASSVRSEFESTRLSSYLKVNGGNVSNGKLKSADDLIGLLGKKLTKEDKENIKEYLSKIGFDDPADIYRHRSEAARDMLNEEKTLRYALSIKTEESLNKSGEELSKDEYRKFLEEFPKPKGEDSYASIQLRKLDQKEKSEERKAKLELNENALRDKYEKTFGHSSNSRDVKEMKEELKEYRAKKLPKEIEAIKDKPEKINAVLPKEAQSKYWGKQTVSGFSDFEDYGADKPDVKELKSWVDKSERYGRVEVRDESSKQYPIEGKNASWVVKEKTIFATDKWSPSPKTWVLKDVKELYYKDKKGEKLVTTKEDYYDEGG